MRCFPSVLRGKQRMIEPWKRLENDNLERRSLGRSGKTLLLALGRLGSEGKVSMGVDELSFGSKLRLDYDSFHRSDDVNSVQLCIGQLHDRPSAGACMIL